MMRIIMVLLLIPAAAALLDVPNATVNEPFTFVIDPQEFGERSIIGVYLPQGIEIDVPQDAYYDAEEHLLVFEDLAGPVSLTGFAVGTGDAYYEVVYIVPPRQAGIFEVTASIAEPEPRLIEQAPDRSSKPSGLFLVGVLLAIMVSITLGYLRYTKR